jgi:peptidylprolyl isomerase
MTQAKQGDTVRVHFTGKLNDGTVFGTSADRDPLQFTIGKGRILEGFQQAVVGMNAGESKTTKIPAEEAYGAHDEEMVLVVDRKQIPEDIEPEVGDELTIRQPDGETFLVTVAEVSDSGVTLDANHPLAGEDLTFDIQLVEIV